MNALKLKNGQSPDEEGTSIMSKMLLMLATGIATFLVLILFFLFRQLSRLRSQIKLLTIQLKEEDQKKQSFIAELSDLKKQVDDAILYDVLTGLPSRQVFEDRLAQTIIQSKRHKLFFGVMFLDIDDFKVINDALGYEAGDELLKKVAVRLQSALRQVDTICRFSGDQFVLLLPQITKGEVCAYVAQRLLDAISQPFSVQNQDLFVTASIGITIFPADSDDGKALLKNADSALHQAKSHGCNVYQFYQEQMQKLSQRELALKSSLRSTSMIHEFSIRYQPQVNIHTKEIVCMEALLRWQHPEFGLITPREFLHLAEASGHMMEIDEWVLRKVCEQFQSWKSQQLHLERVAVNISVSQLENSHFIHKISKILHETNMSPKALILEIVDGVHPQATFLEKNLQMLRQMGVQLAIDGFGTGYLSLQQLSRFSIDYLKIDSTLVQDIVDNPESAAISKMMIALAQILGLGVIAEGVETREQKDLLEKLGCYVMQGHLFSVPRQPEDFTVEVERMIGEGS